MAEQNRDTDMSLNPAELYREEVFTDRRVGSLLRLTPVDGDGAPDPNRTVLYVGQTQILTPAGSLPISFEIVAGSLKEAAEKFAGEAKKAVDDTMKQLRELRRDAASSIVIPEGGGGGVGSLGGAPGGGKIQLR